MKRESCESCKYLVQLKDNNYCGKDMIKNDTEYYNENIYDLENTKCGDYDQQRSC